jgi:cellulose synthase (UDP-forming)
MSDMDAPLIRDERIFTSWDWVVFCALSALNLTAVAWMLTNWLRMSWREHAVILVIVALIFLRSILLFEARWFALPLASRPRYRPPQPGWRVATVTTFVPGAEDLEMLRNTVAAMVSMSYGHDTWVLDEGDDPDVRAFCDELGACHFSRKGIERYHQPEGRFETRTKHGNYNAWLDASACLDHYDIIVNFDPDHIPRREFLERTLGYLDDPRVGYVQAAQVYYNQPASFIARGAAEETYAYYATGQMLSHTVGYPIVTGCHTVNRASALRDVGGYAPHEADDLLITLHYRSAGWRGVYVPEILAEGLTPVDWSGYLSQQRRWARSTLDIQARHLPRLAGSLPRLERLLAFVHGLYYLQGVTTMLSLAILVFMLAVGVAPGFLHLKTLPVLVGYVLVFEVCNLYRQRFFLDPKHKFKFHWRARVLLFAKWPVILLAVIDAALGKRGPYTITNKTRQKSHTRLVLAPVHLATAAVVAMTALIGVWWHGDHSAGVIVAASVVMLFSVTISATELFEFPNPYDPQLLVAATQHRH